MKYLLFLSLFLLPFGLEALEYKVLFENQEVSFAQMKMMPGEKTGLHRDALQQIVFAIKGGTITRLEANGTTTDVHFPTGITVVRGIDPPNELHASINKGSEPIELLVLSIKKK